MRTCDGWRWTCEHPLFDTLHLVRTLLARQTPENSEIPVRVEASECDTLVESEVETASSRRLLSLRLLKAFARRRRRRNLGLDGDVGPARRTSQVSSLASPTPRDVGRTG